MILGTQIKERMIDCQQKPFVEYQSLHMRLHCSILKTRIVSEGSERATENGGRRIINEEIGDDDDDELRDTGLASHWPNVPRCR